MLDVVIWYLTLSAVGLITLPIGMYLFRSLNDLGYIIHRFLGVIFISYISWILGTTHLIKFSVPSIIISFLILATISYLIYPKVKKHFTKSFFKKALIYELILLVLFLLFVFLKAYRSEIWTWEQLMDFGFVNSILKTDYFPPQDPWYAGHSMNYYYFGHVMAAVLTKITAIKPSIAFDLMQATIYTFFSAGIFSLGYNLSKKLKAGIFTMLIAAFLGNASIYYLNDSVYWQSSLVLPNAPTEYPILSFLMGELHAHFVDLSIAVIAFLAIYQYFLNKDKSITLKVFIGFLLSIMYFTNSWDFVIYGGFIGVIIAYKLINKIDFNFSESLKDSLLIGASSLVFVLPFLLSFKPAVSGIGIVSETPRSPLQNFISLFLLQTISVLIYLLYRFSKLKISNKTKIFTLILSLTLFALVYNFAQTSALFAFLVPYLFLDIRDDYKAKKLTRGVFVDLIILYSFVIINFCEFFFVNDVYTGINERYNTVFKLYMELWIFLSLATGYIFYYFANLKTKFKYIFFGLGIFMIAASMIHIPSIYVNTIRSQYKNPQLDGDQFYKLNYRNDYFGIVWINDNLKKQYIVAETPSESPDYDASRVSAYTGQATPMGWIHHEANWRPDQESTLQETVADINEMYTTSDLDKAKSIIAKYKINYIFYGIIEQRKYGSTNDKAISKLYRAVYSNKSVKIFTTDIPKN